MLRLAARLNEVRTLAFSPDNRYLLAVGAKPLLGLFRVFRLAFWDLSDPTATPRAGIDNGLDPIAGFFLPNGQMLGVDNLGEWQLCGVNGNTIRRSGPLGRQRKVEPAAVSPDGQWLALIGSGRIEGWPLPGNSRAAWRVELDDWHEASRISFSPKSEVMAVVVRGWWESQPLSWIEVRDADTGAYIRDAQNGSQSRGTGPEDLFTAAWSPDSNLIARVGRNGFDVFDVYTWAVRARQTVAGAPLTAAAYHPSGQMLATADKVGRVQFWDAAEWESHPDGTDHPPAQTFDWSVGEVSVLAFSRDGTLGAVAGRRGDVVVWDVDV